MASYGNYMTKPKVLVVDDDFVTCNLIETYLKMEGYQTASINRIENNDMITVIDREKPDIILLDFHLGSHETTKYVSAIRASEQWSWLPVIMTSAIDYRRRCLEAGATDFIVKPFDWEDVTTRINSILSDSIYQQV